MTNNINDMINELISLANDSSNNKKQINELKKLIIDSGISSLELNKMIPIDVQVKIDFIIPKNEIENKNTFLGRFYKKGYLTLKEFIMSCIPNKSFYYMKEDLKLSRGNLCLFPYNSIFKDFSIKNDGSILLKPLNVYDFAMSNVFKTINDPLELSSLKEEYFSGNMSDDRLYEVINKSLEKHKEYPSFIDMQETLKYYFLYGNKECALYNLAALSFLTEQYNLEIRYLTKDNEGPYSYSHYIYLDRSRNNGTCVHELGHAIHKFLRNNSLPVNYYRSLFKAKKEIWDNRSDLPEFIKVLNNNCDFYTSVKNGRVENTYSKKIERALDKLFDNCINILDDPNLKVKLLEVYDNFDFSGLFLDEEDKKYILNKVKSLKNMSEDDKRKLEFDKDFMKYSLTNNFITKNANNAYNCKLYSDLLSGLIGNNFIVDSNGSSLNFSGHTFSYYLNLPNVFMEMFANYNEFKCGEKRNTFEEMREFFGSEFFDSIEKIYNGDIETVVEDKIIDKNDMNDLDMFFLRALYSDLTKEEIDDYNRKYMGTPIARLLKEKLRDFRGNNEIRKDVVSYYLEDKNSIDDSTKLLLNNINHLQLRKVLEEDFFTSHSLSHAILEEKEIAKRDCNYKAEYIEKRLYNAEGTSTKTLKKYDYYEDATGIGYYVNKDVLSNFYKLDVIEKLLTEFYIKNGVNSVLIDYIVLTDSDSLENSFRDGVITLNRNFSIEELKKLIESKIYLEEREKLI